ncbi:MAG: phytanoyl-CoA dioxygenase family protein [Candidatus Latescibacteria bacterium]|nr:phytanoyl-CoA dioxygenase family protein [Candidatus Latescibacterota bacterium]
MLSATQIEDYHRDGYLLVPAVFNPAEVAELREELDWIFAAWADHNAAWQGPWREVYMDEAQRQQAVLVAINDLHLHSARWQQAAAHPRLTAALAALLGPDVELHHTTLHAKPPQVGSPFPLHQDNAFFAHQTPAYADAILHLDDAPEEAGCLRFVPGSHRLGPLAHIREGGAPHLPTDQYRLADTAPVPARAGDVVLFNLWTIHGSDLNHTPHWRRAVRLGYRDPANLQLDGHALGRLGWMVRGRRQKNATTAALAR